MQMFFSYYTINRHFSQKCALDFVQKYGRILFNVRNMNISPYVMRYIDIIAGRRGRRPLHWTGNETFVAGAGVRA